MPVRIEAPLTDPKCSVLVNGVELSFDFSLTSDVISALVREECCVDVKFKNVQI